MKFKIENARYEMGDIKKKFATNVVPDDTHVLMADTEYLGNNFFVGYFKSSKDMEKVIEDIQKTVNEETVNVVILSRVIGTAWLRLSGALQTNSYKGGLYAA